jgi:hypothetical protein
MMGVLRDDLCTFMVISRLILLRIRNISDKFVDKIKTQILCSITPIPPPPKIVPFMR